MHSHSQHNQHEQTEGNLKLAFWLNTVFAVVEVFGGIATNSIAVLSDAVHDAGDSVALGIAWYFHRISSRKRDKTFTFGYKRFSVLGALVNSLILLSGSAIILVEAIPRIFSPQHVNAQGMMYLAFLGIFVNGFAAFRVRKGETQNEKVISLHLLEDLMGWMSVLVVSIVLRFYDVPILDPLLSIAITLFILYRLYGSLRKTFRILLQGTPKQMQAEEIEKHIREIPEILAIHDLHIWTMDGSFHVATLHLEVANEMNLQETEVIKEKVRHELHHLGIAHATLEIELQGQTCDLNDC
ncbi:MAG: cation transporter [Bacteroidetes bacterium]|nr:cation transporter [Bacteroidota bacterium]